MWRMICLGDEDCCHPSYQSDVHSDLTVWSMVEFHVPDAATLCLEAKFKIKSPQR